MSKVNLFSRSLGAALLVLSGLLLTAPAYARIVPKVTFGAEYISKFGNSCTVNPQTPLPYAKASVDYFASNMTYYGNRRHFVYGESSAETTDISDKSDVRSGIAGKDHLYADNVEAYVVYTHGGVDPGSNNFSMSMCTSTSWSNDARWAWEASSSYATRWGDGSMRWALLYTCDGLEKPYLSWKDSFGPEFEVIMGFSGDAYSSWSTDENLGDWVSEVYGSKRAFKGSWFYANEDWYVDYMDAVLMAVGDSLNEAVHRRDNQSIFYSRRQGKSATPKAFAWSNKIQRQRERKYNFVR